MFTALQQAYQHWKKLNNIVANDLHSRKINFPEALSENIACYALDMTRNMSNSGDATDSEGNLVEIKATSNFDSDLSSFSPVTQFDRLIFVRLDLNTDKAYIYDLNLDGQQFGQLAVNATEIVADHQAQGRRPRLSLIKYIEKHEIQPLKIVNLS